LYAYVSEHILTKAELARIGTRLPAQSSALLFFAETIDPSRLLEATTNHAPSVVSAATIGDDLTTRVFAGPSDHLLPLDQRALLSMILFRYPETETAKQVASRIAANSAQPANLPDVELVIKTDRSGHRHVTDPSHGVAAWAKC
jgi:hypothetical protein